MLPAIAPPRLVGQHLKTLSDDCARHKPPIPRLIDALTRPMPSHATAPIKTKYLREELPGLLRRLRSLAVGKDNPIILIGTLTFAVCAPILKEGGFHIVNEAAINHPARGGQRLFRKGLKAALQLPQSTP
jgi:hypothetical protein